MKSFSLLTFALSIPLAAFAAEPAKDVPVTLDQVGVSADRYKPLTIPSLEESRADLARVPGGAETIDFARFARGRASTVNDIFALSAGVVAQSRFGSDEARISIRGSGLQRTFHGRGLRILQDGVPLNLADGSFDMQSFEPLAAAYVNVWRGANALAYGASTLGGAIDFVSRTGRESGDGGGVLRVEAGSFGYLRAFAAGGFAAGNKDAYAAVTRTELDGFRAHARQRNARLLANAGWRIGDRVETRFYLAYVATDSELPGSLFKAEVRSTPRIANPTTAAQNQKRDFEPARARPPSASAARSSMPRSAGRTRISTIRSRPSSTKPRTTSSRR
jgi:iron complex outermembrane receptor protein